MALEVVYGIVPDNSRSRRMVVGHSRPCYRRFQSQKASPSPTMRKGSTSISLDNLDFGQGTANKPINIATSPLHAI